MIIMGKVVNAFGIRGWIRIYPYTEHTDSLLGYETWWFEGKNKHWDKMQVITGRVSGNFLDAKLKDCDDRDHALEFKGLQIAVPRADLPELPDNGKEGYYWSDLIGNDVISLKNEKLGTIVNLIDTGTTDVLLVKTNSDERNEILIPFIEQTFIKKVDLKNRQVIVDWEKDY